MEVFEAIAEVAAARGIPYFVVGATARDMILSHGHGIASKRATVDIDLGIEVAEWDEFSALKDEDMMCSSTGVGDAFEECLQLLEILKTGIQESQG
ncbi:MAG: hypothetical protein KZQ89_16900 [Candidatus Thiodiazotropha sp. (ex Lucinoma kastoroae)]|nr:hypothetical protein [Candidatus Thiodiazotropha sp. (ex Rostrolucina anterorostrata)]MCU7849632.1 hypothetical protein [Candidatus Thiodiazotropha sp. (ex Lucinoma kastoroae)]